MTAEDTSLGDLPYSAASQRNRVPILQALRDYLPLSGTLIEIGAGTGQHAVYMAPSFPALNWLPTERRSEIPGLAARLALQGSNNILAPVQLDVLTDPWPKDLFTAAYSANTSHIMSWQAVQAMMRGVGACLVPGGRFCLYGPFNADGDFTAPSNEAFDRGLRARDPAMGLRDIEALESEAGRLQMILAECRVMPVNNFLLVFRKR